MWMDFIFPLIWIIGVTFYMYEMTINFKVHHEEKIRMTYRAEGGGLQKYAIFQRGYT